VTSPYEFLGIKEGASKTDVKKAYLEMIRLYHPDLHPDDEYALEMSKKVNEAYQAILKNKPFSYSEYDMDRFRKDNDELRKCKGEYSSLISSFRYIELSYYMTMIANASSTEEIWRIYEDAKRENARVLLVQTRVNVIALNCLSKLEKNTYLQNVAQVIRNSNGDYNEKVIFDIENIYLEVVRRNAILGINRLAFLDSNDRLKYLEIINSAPNVSIINNSLSEATFESYKRGAIYSINGLDSLSHREKSDYLLSIENVVNIAQLRDIVGRAKAHNEANNENKLTSKIEKMFSSMFDSKVASQSKGRKI